MPSIAKLSKFPKGFTLVELMVSLFIASIIFAGVLQVVANGKRTFLDEEEMAFIQENARFAVDILERDIRLAGYAGCANLRTTPIANSVGDSTFVSTTPLQGFDGSDPNLLPSEYRSDATLGSDSFMVRYADSASNISVKSHATGASSITVWNSPRAIRSGTKLVIVDANCRHAGIFALSAAASKGEGAFSYGGGCTNVIRSSASFDCVSACTDALCDGNAPQAYLPGSNVMSYVSNAYYIGESGVIPGMPALKKHSLIDGGGTRSEELAPGVERLILLYGVDTNSDGSVNRFSSSGDVSDWAKVIAVRFTLVFRSQNVVFSEVENPSDASRTIKIDGGDFDLPNDRYLRQVVSSTVRLRNL